MGCRGHPQWCGRIVLAQVAESASRVYEMRPPREWVAGGGPGVAWHISQATRVPSIVECQSGPSFVRWLASTRVMRRGVAVPSRVVYTVLHEMRMWCSLERHTCPHHVECTGPWNVRVSCTLISCMGCCCVVLLCLSTVLSGCILGMKRAGGVCTCCCGLRSWHILVSHSGAPLHDGCRGLTHRTVLLWRILNCGNVCCRAWRTCPLPWL